MPDRVVYLVENLLPIHKEAAHLEFVDHEGLSKLLSDGYETSTTLAGQKVKAGGKSVAATMMILKQAAENRAVATAERASGDGGQLIQVPDGFGGTRSVTMMEAMLSTQRDLALAISEQGRHVGHLGAPSRPKIPGLTIVSGETVQQMFDAGQLAAASGKCVEDCPMPPGTEAATKWLQGFRSAEGRRESEDRIPEGVSAEQHEKNWTVREDRAYAEGNSTARSVGKDDQVHNPHARSHPRIRDAWIRGFKAGGGTVI